MRHAIRWIRGRPIAILLDYAPRMLGIRQMSYDHSNRKNNKKRETDCYICTMKNVISQSKAAQTFKIKVSKEGIDASFAPAFRQPFVAH